MPAKMFRTLWRPVSARFETHAAHAGSALRPRVYSTSSARTSAPSLRPKVMVRPDVRRRKSRHARIVGIQHGDPVAGSASTNSRLAAAIPSMESKNSMCA